MLLSISVKIRPKEYLAAVSIMKIGHEATASGFEIQSEARIGKAGGQTAERIIHGISNRSESLVTEAGRVF